MEIIKEKIALEIIKKQVILILTLTVIKIY